MKPLLQEGPAGQVYGYLLTDSLAASVASGGGLGLRSILQAQLGSIEGSSPKP
jgi:Rod binding domain-containing protein